MDAADAAAAATSPPRMQFPIDGRLPGLRHTPRPLLAHPPFVSAMRPAEAIWQPPPRLHQGLPQLASPVAAAQPLPGPVSSPVRRRQRGARTGGSPLTSELRRASPPRRREARSRPPPHVEAWRKRQAILSRLQAAGGSQRTEIESLRRKLELSKRRVDAAMQDAAACKASLQEQRQRDIEVLRRPVTSLFGPSMQLRLAHSFFGGPGAAASGAQQRRAAMAHPRLGSEEALFGRSRREPT